MRTIDWVDGRIIAIEQTLLPDVVSTLRIETVDQLVDAIKRLAIRGAPALGVAGALGVALAACNGGDVRAAAARVRAARPTAVNLAWGVDRVLARLDDGLDAVVAEAVRVLEDDIRRNRELGFRGAKWLVDRLGGPVNVQTHCNAGRWPASSGEPRWAWSGRCWRPAGSATFTWTRPGRCCRAPG